MYPSVKLNNIGISALNKNTIKNLTVGKIYEVEDISIDEDSCRCYTILNDVGEVEGYYINFFELC